MKPIQSLIERTKSFLVQHYKYTFYCLSLKKYRNIHNNDSCFVIGNGPSLSPEDLKVLCNNNISSFAANRIYKMFDNTNWRPTYYVCTDYLLIRDFLDEANAIPAKRKFTSLHNHFYCGINLENCTYFNYLYPQQFNEKSFNGDACDGMYWLGTVTNCMIQLAIHMGFKNIYLIGIDHNFDRYIDENGNEVIDETVKNYFCDQYDNDIINEVHRDLGQSTKGYYWISNYAKENGINIKNVSRQTKLTVFPRVTFEEAVRDIQNEKKEC